MNNLLKVAAICSFLGATTTALLIFLPSPQAPDFETDVLLYKNGLYLTKLWILFLHPQVNFIASIGAGYLLVKKYPLQIILGTLFLSIWAYTEMSQQSLLIDALNQQWRPEYMAADDETVKNMYATLIKAAKGISSSNYFLVIYGFGLGSLFYGLGLIWEEGFGRALGICLVFIGILSLASFVRYYLDFTLLNPLINWCYSWIYPFLQPLVRIGLGIWILIEIKRKTNTSEIPPDII